MTGELVERLARLEDLAEIQQLYIDYGRHLDAGDPVAYAELFARDAKLRLGPVMRADGRAAIEAVATEVLRAGDERTVHVLASPRITLDGDRATGECVWVAITQPDSGSPPVRVGRHLDKLVREDGRWRFAERKGLIDVGTVSAPG
ncbi:nuclear transport factor 2 family protein [Nocardia sp. alder85J]|uniref:nuclear transport factor 2 family protein n=1 Tax=Nocardia sp. alder85J TaxID=2862949 RepID=UPI001CD38941|nr:nuclear transport factor 2 family protein [Nocardia sp. alder85J]MCX4091483.1 nuclear transport factor 2 family protein [Nocardia sp. alder85J]